MKRAFSIAIAAALLATGSIAHADHHAGASAAIAAAVADDRRPEVDTARDPLRKPAEIVAFAGVEPGMSIAEIAPGGGYFTRILAESVGPDGKIYALMPAFFANRPGGLDGINALAEEYGNIEVVVIDYADTVLPEPVDLVWTTENYHDLANGDIAVVNNWVAGSLKPDGIFFVEDHSAPGTGTEATNTIHRIDPMAVIAQVTEAGLVLEATSDLLANPDDPRDISPREVQPTSEKFALRFRKPE
ncbi:class I SAM-dependent methyltransferase [Alteraurantiacibacter aquimixticola]|uniref:Methyltransferase n=1 Tax=Alteraurantiacibacter aquimixticola TaxID=2489173 RepID=A0A4T3F419_9SPHN|nr:class I SAM-dependent methyltransferase [Alteraurantiacibacter aquimixticola]TIX52045.1 methyltransferase [Alteraurantiacibacter aquimixticola]